MKQNQIVWLTVRKNTTLEKIATLIDLGWDERPDTYFEEWSSFETAQKVIANFAHPEQYKIVKFERIVTLEEVSK